MKIFVVGDKVNFVDENNVLLGYDMGQDCCEYADWFIAGTPCKSLPKKYASRMKRDGLPDLTGFVFDKDFFREVHNGSLEDGGMVIFRIVSGKTKRYIHLFNVHNGYYAHGFSFSNNKIDLKQGYL